MFTPEAKLVSWSVMLPQAVMKSKERVNVQWSVLLLRTTFGFMVLLLPGAVLTSMVSASTEDHTVVHGLYHCLRPC